MPTPGPVTIQDCASIQRTYRVFRTLGLRHLVVVDAGNKVRGIITRKDLDHHTLEERLAWAANEAETQSFSVEGAPVDHGALQRRDSGGYLWFRVSFRGGGLRF